MSSLSRWAARQAIQIIFCIALWPSMAVAQDKTPENPVKPGAPSAVALELDGLAVLGLSRDWKQQGFLVADDVALLVDPRWRKPRTAELALQNPFSLPGEADDATRGEVRGFKEDEIRILKGEDGYFRTLIWRKVRDVGADFLEAIFDKQPRQRDSLAELVSRDPPTTLPLVTFEPLFRLHTKGQRTWMEVHLTVRVFRMETAPRMINGSAATQVVSCEMLFEDRSLGSAPMDAPAISGQLDKAVRASLIDALRRRIALSLVANGLIRGELHVPPPNLLGLSLSAVGLKKKEDQP